MAARWSLKTGRYSFYIEREADKSMYSVLKDFKYLKCRYLHTTAIEVDCYFTIECTIYKAKFPRKKYWTNYKKGSV